MRQQIPVVDLEAALGGSPPPGLRPGQVSAWRESRPYVAPLAENSAGL
jgi:hypothetical protein